MRHNYVGDEGDYAKLALLRALQGGGHLGVNWYLTVHEEGEGTPGGADGNKQAYAPREREVATTTEARQRVRRSLGTEISHPRVDGNVDLNFGSGATHVWVLVRRLVMTVREELARRRRDAHAGPTDT